MSLIRGYPPGNYPAETSIDSTAHEHATIMVRCTLIGASRKVNTVGYSLAVTSCQPNKSYEAQR